MEKSFREDNFLDNVGKKKMAIRKHFFSFLNIKY